MKYNDINKEYTIKVNQLLAEGYIINSLSMSGHQGEISKIDLVKDDKLLRVMLKEEYQFFPRDDDKYDGRIVYLRVCEWSRPASESTRRTVWDSEMNIISQTKYYHIDNRNSIPYSWYVTDVEEAIRYRKLRLERWANRPCNDKYEVSFFLSDKAKEIGVKYLKNHEGYQRVSRDKIRVQKVVDTRNNSIRYSVEYNGNSYKLH